MSGLMFRNPDTLPDTYNPNAKAAEAFRKPLKSHSWIPLLACAVCLFAGCLQPSSLSEEERTSKSHIESSTETEIPKEISKDILPPKVYLIDTGLYHVGDSWEYESVEKEVGGNRVISKTQERFTLISKNVVTADTIGFAMEVFRSKVDLDSTGTPGPALKFQSHVKYTQSTFGLVSASINWTAPDTTALIRPGQFPAYSYWKIPESRGGIEPDALLCKDLRYKIISGNGMYSINFKALFSRSSGLLWFRVYYRIPGTPPEVVSRLVARNGIPIPEFIVP